MGSKPLLRGYQCINKPVYSNSTTDIERACPKPLHVSLNKPNFNLMTSDIEKAQPRQVEFVTNRVTNPLNPDYKLPSFEVRPVTPPRFVRDSIAADDIEGTRPEIYHRWTTRDSISVRDIDGARPRPERVLEKPNLMDPKDINGVPFQTRRNCNPLEPEYLGRDSEGNLVALGVIEGARSKPLVSMRMQPHKRNLESSDIEGARPCTVGHGPFGGSKERNYVKSGVDVKDIEGTNVGSAKKGLVTKRVTNPLEPKYAWTTEEPEDAKKGEKNEKGGQQEVKNEEMVKNNCRFWGITPVNSRTNSLPPSRPSTSRPASYYGGGPGFQKNLHKFYDQPVPPNVQQEDIKISADKFYANSNPKIADKFLSVSNPNTIHRIKKDIPVINMAQFNQNIKSFCGVSSGNNSRPNSSQSSYKFALSRAEIAKPV